MENYKKVDGKPMKFILHMAKQDNEWAGKAVSFEKNKEMKFKSLDEFRNWLEVEIISENGEYKNEL